MTQDDSFILSGGEDAVVHVWSLLDLLDTSTANDASSSLQRGCVPLFTWTDHVLPITSIHCGLGGYLGRVYTSSLDRTVKVFDLPTGKSLLSITAPSYINVCIADPLEHRLFLGAGNGHIYVVDLHAAATAATAANARVLHTHNDYTKSSSAGFAAADALSTDGFVGHEFPVTSLVVSECGQYLISGDDDGQIRVWDTLSRQALRTVSLVKGTVTSMTLLQSRPEGLFHPAKTTSRITVAPLKKYL